jgi:hypothetical protein
MSSYDEPRLKFAVWYFEIFHCLKWKTWRDFETSALLFCILRDVAAVSGMIVKHSE